MPECTDSIMSRKNMGNVSSMNFKSLYLSYKNRNWGTATIKVESSIAFASIPMFLVRPAIATKTMETIKVATNTFCSLFNFTSNSGVFITSSASGFKPAPGFAFRGDSVAFFSFVFFTIFTILIHIPQSFCSGCY